MAARSRAEERRGRHDDERGSGSLLGIAVVTAVLVVMGMLVPVAGALVVKQRVTAAADSAALAAADTLSGLLPGYPCERADASARLAQASIVDCVIDAPTVTVTVSARYLVFDVAARARAGPPGTAR